MESLVCHLRGISPAASHEHDFFLLSKSEGEIQVIDSISCELIKQVEISGEVLGVNGSGNLVLTELQTSLEVVELMTGKVISRIPLPGVSSGLEISPDWRRIISYSHGRIPSVLLYYGGG